MTEFWATFWGNLISTILALAVTLPVAVWWEDHLDEARTKRHERKRR